VAAGAAGLQNGVWVLPRSAGHAELFQQLICAEPEHSASDSDNNHDDDHDGVEQT
jgi:hypothetical protein